jgi:putative flippase GtrA
MTIIVQIREYLSKFPTVKQFIKFCIVGGTAALINFLFLLFLTEHFHFWYVISSIIGFIVSAFFNFLANKFWTFRHGALGRQAFLQALKFSLVVISGLIINTILIYIITEYIGFDYRLSWVFATAIVTFWNFSLNRFWTFRHYGEKL